MAPSTGKPTTAYQFCMSKIVQLRVAPAEHLDFMALDDGHTGFSREAAETRAANREVVESVKMSHALAGPKNAAISQLSELESECAEPGWDGDGTAAVDPIAVLLAQNIVRLIPDDVPLPEFAPEPDGSISLDWIQSRNRLCSVSVGHSDRRAYAWLDGADKGHAVARFDGERFPSRILETVLSIVGRNRAGLRAA